MKNFDLIYRNNGKAAAHKITQIAMSISRSNSKDAGPWNVPLMSTEGCALAKKSAPGSAYEIPYLDDSRERFAVSDEEREAWRKFKNGDDPSAIQPDPLSALSAESNEEEEPEEEESDEVLDEESEEDLAEENRELARTQGGFDRQRLYRAIDRLTRRTKKRLAKGHDNRSYGRDNRSGRSYAACTGMIGGVEEWNRAFARGEVC